MKELRAPEIAISGALRAEDIEAAGFALVPSRTQACVVRSRAAGR